MKKKFDLSRVLSMLYIGLTATFVTSFFYPENGVLHICNYIYAALGVTASLGLLINLIGDLKMK